MLIKHLKNKLHIVSVSFSPYQIHFIQVALESKIKEPRQQQQKK